MNNMNENSKTWCNYFSKVCIQYGVTKPSFLLKQSPPKLSEFRRDIDIRITAFHEKYLRKKASNTRRLKYFNVKILGLSGKCHPAITNMFTVNEVKRSRFHTKILLGDIYTYQIKCQQQGGEPYCVLCKADQTDQKYEESVFHILIKCTAYKEIREKFIPQYQELLNKRCISFQGLQSDNEEFCQFIIDCTSLNLKHRLTINDPLVSEIFKISRNFCNDICVKRLQLLGCRRYQ